MNTPPINADHSEYDDTGEARDANRLSSREITARIPAVAIKLEEQSGGGWEWSITMIDFWGDTVTEYGQTGWDFCGLWCWTRTNCWHQDHSGRSVCPAEDFCYTCGEWKQRSGTCQFSLPTSRSRARSALRRRALAHDIYTYTR